MRGAIWKAMGKRQTKEEFWFSIFDVPLKHG
jgi:hypothetical protein